MISQPELDKDEQEIIEGRMAKRIESLMTLADKGDNSAINRVIEPIGNDDAVTKALIELLSLARVDECEDHRSPRYSEKVEHIRNQTRLAALNKFVSRCDAYYASMLEGVL